MTAGTSPADAWPGDITPVGISEIAATVGVRPDTVKKWIDRHAAFPKQRGTVGGDRAWLWGDVRRWLQDTGRLPRHFRARDWNGSVRYQGIIEGPDGEDRWETLATFHEFDHDGSWGFTVTPSPRAIEDMGGDRAAAQVWADRLFAGWEAARVKWVKEHPDEPMPAHLIGSRRAFYREDAD